MFTFMPPTPAMLTRPHNKDKTVVVPKLHIGVVPLADPEADGKRSVAIRGRTSVFFFLTESSLFIPNSMLAPLQAGAWKAHQEKIPVA